MNFFERINLVLVIICLILLVGCNSSNGSVDLSSKRTVFTPREKDSIIDGVMDKTQLYFLNSQERREVLDSAIVAHPSIAYFYQQRAMPLYKQDKDELGLPFLEKAAELDPIRYLDYMAFMKCIFSKNYKNAIIDFHKALELLGESYVMDHSYYFYLGLCHLQLNEFEKARDFFDRSIAQSVKEHGKDWVHFTDLMYLGIAEYELENYEKAILNFDRALGKQPQFCEVKYYKALCFYELGDYGKYEINFKEAKTDYLEGSVMFEDNTIYERYPYQIRKGWLGL